MTNWTDWNNLFKVNLSNIVDESMNKHDVVKLLLVRKLLYKYKKRDFIRIYTEFILDNQNKVDIYFEDIKNKAVYIYEIQKDYSKEWLKTKTEEYKNYQVPFFKTVDFIPINLNEFTNDINEINKKLEKYIV